VGEGGVKASTVRKVGAAMLAIAAVLAWLCIWEPLREAANGARSVSLSLKGAALVPVVALAGLLYAAVPNWAVQIMGAPFERERKNSMWFVLGPSLALGLLVYWALKAKLAAYGYR
jgi:hypothetical protein